MRTPNAATFDQYRARPGINATALKAGLTSMRHMRHVMQGGGRQDTPSLRWGRLIHRAVLEPDKWRDGYVVFDGRRAGKAWDEFATANAGRDIITPGELDDLTALVASVKANKLAADLLAGCEPEISLTWNDNTYGQAKARIDGLADNYAVEFKSTRGISQDTFERSSFSLGYHVQLGWYTEGLRILNRQPRIYVIAVETAPPFDCVVYQADEALVDYGQRVGVQLAAQYRACERSKCFPGVQGDNLRVLSLPTWAMEQAERMPDQELDVAEL